MRILARKSAAFSTYLHILYGLVISAAGNILCPGNYTSDSIPTSVHRLKPGDFSIVAGMGDSLITGTGAEAKNFLDTLVEYRGRSFSTGGDMRYHKGVATFSNILRVFNPNIHGFSMGVGNSNSIFAGLNVGQFGASAKDMLAQARLLVQRIKDNVWMDINKDWKVLTILVGTNDMCKSCQDKKKYSVENYVNNIKAALDHLHANLPRTLVNFVEMYGIGKVRDMVRFHSRCERNLRMHYCPCVTKSDVRGLDTLTKSYADAVQRLVSSGRYDTKKDFTVVIQPFLRDMTAPKFRNSTPDATYFAPDCVHWSSKGHNVMGIALWNTMLHKVGEKQEHVNIHDQPKCPYTKFIPTRLNISDGTVAILKPKNNGSHNKNNSSSQRLHHQSVTLLMLCVFNMIFG